MRVGWSRWTSRLPSGKRKSNSITASPGAGVGNTVKISDFKSLLDVDSLNFSDGLNGLLAVINAVVDETNDELLGFLG